MTRVEVNQKSESIHKPTTSRCAELPFNTGYCIRDGMGDYSKSRFIWHDSGKGGIDSRARDDVLVSLRNQKRDSIHFKEIKSNESVSNA